jgi:site-specific recombinase XerD
MGVSFSLSRPHSKRSSIRAKISVSGTSIFLYTGVSIETEHWDKKKCFVRPYVGKTTTTRVLRILKELEISILDLIDQYKYGRPKLTFVELEEKLQELVESPHNKYNKEKKQSVVTKESFNSFFDHFYNDCANGIRLTPKRQRLKPTALSTYDNSRSLFTKFQKEKGYDIALSDFKQEYIDAFSDYIINDLELAMNTHSKAMMEIMQVIKYAVKLKKLPSSRLSELEFDTRREETDSIYLKESEVIELLQVKDFDEPIHEMVRDVFVIGCFTGMRFSDYTTIDTAAIQENRLSFIQQKTGGRVTLPIHPVVNTILNKYNYQLPEVPKNNVFNQILKQIGAKMPSLQVSFTRQVTYKRELQTIVKKKYEFLQTHTARRSFCSNEYLKGTDPLVIMAISGHKSHKSFMRYIKVSGDEFADKLEKIWAARESKAI